MLFINLMKNSYSDDFYDYPLYILVDACNITQERYDPKEVSQDEMLEGREKYRLCMNFIMSLSTTLNDNFTFLLLIKKLFVLLNLSNI